jgi:hypothetical protein
MRRVQGKLTEDYLKENLTNAIGKYLFLESQGASLEQLALQRGIVDGCAMQLLSWCNPAYHGSTVKLADVKRIFIDMVMEAEQRGDPVVC